MKHKKLKTGALAAMMLGVASVGAQAGACKQGQWFADDGSICDVVVDQPVTQPTPQVQQVQQGEVIVRRHLIKGPGGAFKDSKSVWVRHSTEPRAVKIDGSFAPGSLVLDQQHQLLYFVNAKGQAIRYVVAVGREGMQMNARPRVISEKEENPYWDDGKGNVNNGLYNRGPAAPLGARGLHMVTAGSRHDEGFMIHGTNRPELLGKPDGKRKISHGCIRMFNGDVVDLYNRVQVGAMVHVLPRGGIELTTASVPKQRL